MRKAGWMGWYTVAVAFLALMFNYGIRYTNTVLFTDVKNELSLSRGQASLPFTLCLMVYAVGAPLVGWMVDRVGPRWVMVVGGTVAGLGLWLCSYMHNLLAFILFFGVIFGVGGNGIGLVPSNTAVAYWFKEKLGTALGVATMGIGVGTLLLPVATNFFVNRLGWRTAFQVLGGMIWVILVPLAFFLSGRRKRGEEPEGGLNILRNVNNNRGFKKGKVLRNALTSSSFWLLFFSFVLAVIAMYGIMLHQVPYAQDKGISKWWATLSVTVLGLTSLVGRVFFGWFSDRVRDRRRALFLAFGMLFSSVVVLIFVRDVSTLMIFAALYGFGYAGYGPLIPALVADHFGRENMGTVFGAITTGGALGGAAGPIIAGWLFDQTGSYTSAWLIAALAALISVIMVWKMRPAPQREEMIDGERGTDWKEREG